MPSLPKCAVVSKTSPVLLSFSVSVMILKSHKEGKWLGNLLILSSSPHPRHTHPLNSAWRYRNQCFSLFPCHSTARSRGRDAIWFVAQDTQWMNILLLLIRSPIDARKQWFNKMKRRKENGCQLVLQQTRHGWEGGDFTAIRGRVGSGWCFICW